MSPLRPTLLLLALLASVALAACGSDQKPARGTPQSPLVADRDKGEPDTAAKNPGYAALVDRQKRHPESRFSPCNLVTASQAASIVGVPMERPLEASQGPTCIYRSRSGSAFVSMAVQATSYRKATRLVRSPRAVAVSGKSGVCGKVGTSMLYLRLSGRQILAIGAPCDVAKQFAAKAMPRL